MMRGSPPVVVTLPKFVLANVTFGFPVVDGVSGDPLRAWNTVPNCQLFVKACTTPPPNPGLCTMTDVLEMIGRSASHGPLFVLGSFGSGYVLPMSVLGSPVLTHLL